MDLSTKLSAKLSSPTLVTLPYPKTPPPSSPPSSPETPPPLPTGDSSVLKDVLLALDRERALRASLEDKLRIANSENKKRSSSDPPPVTPAKDSTLDPKTDAELIDLLTSSTTSHDTTLASLESQNTYLTSKITGLETSLKLLTPSAPKSYQHSLSSPNTSEFIPADLALTLETDPFTTLHLIKKNVGIWEWEGYDGLFKKWSKSQIPKSLKNLERRKSGSGIGQILDVGKGARNYTMEEFKERFNIEEVEVEDIGGGWNWVGGWMIDKNRYGVDEGGWIRGDTPEDIVASKTNAIGNVRGRYLERVRCLRSFPEMSKGAEIFLREVESKAGLEVACKEMGEQVREMCERERVWGEKIERLERIAKEVPGLRKEIEKKNKELKKLMGDTQEIRNQQKVLDSSGGFAGSRNSSSSNSNEGEREGLGVGGGEGDARGVILIH